MDYASDRYRLSSGRVLYANRGLLSLDGQGELYEGYDGSPWVEVAKYAVDAKAVLTTEERAEVAGEMVARWKKWGGIP